MADKIISQLNLHSNVTLSDELAIVNSNETKRSVVGSIGEAIRNMETPLTASSIVSSGDIIPSAAQVASLGSAERPFASLFVQSGSIQIESDTSGDPSAYISNFNGNVDIQAAGFSLTSASLTPFQINNQGQVRIENGFVDPSKLPIFGIIGNNEGSSSLAVNPGTLIQTTGFNGISNRTIFDSYGGSGVFSQVNLRNANGTAYNPSTTVAGVIGRVGVSGWVDGIDFGIPGETALPARIDFRTPGYASGSRPTEIWFYTTPENQLDPQGEYAVKIYGNNVLDVSGSFTASLQENYVWLGNSNNRSEAVPYSTLPNLATGSLMITGSLSGSTITFEKGDSSTFDINLEDTFITPSQTGSFVQSAYISCYNTGSISLLTSGSEQVIDFTSIWAENGISLVDNNKFTFAEPGVYKLEFLATIENDTNDEQDSWFWIKLNGNNFPNSSTKVTVRKRKSDGQHTHQLVSISILGVAQTAGDYVQLYWTGEDTALGMPYEGATVVHPATPSVTLNIIRVG
jgi:hypothetical protein